MHIPYARNLRFKPNPLLFDGNESGRTSEYECNVRACELCLEDGPEQYLLP
jgi:hypothetical protein